MISSLNLHNSTLSWKKIGIAVLVCFLISGCTDEKGDINTWIEQTREEAKPKVEALPEAVYYEPYVHKPISGPNPFDNRRLRTEVAVTVEGGPDPNRTKDYLESLSLSELSMVGSLQGKSGSTALILAGGKVHPVTIGSYLGQDNGRVIAITDSSITLKEQVQDASGKWIERDTVMAVTEANQANK